ncbi:helix-turn-helix transcriptional regulator [Novosphingobium sp. JCM 18896]|uniref:helix-turn-helix transcriptional regulator n=1 Tax=Novosphingobium sp. JCM 18896 TaxID=2989731 RepID=UPI00222276F5|nr:hypothetical protein [Novosphingobium sp. JCM 18896]MCW1432094.1 hypothetical protein [Novosphingobium sp. JCM 18896]
MGEAIDFASIQLNQRLVRDHLHHTVAEIYESATSGDLFKRLPDLIAGSAGARSCVVQKTDDRCAPSALACNWFTTEMTDAYVAQQIYLDDVWANFAVEHGIYDSTTDIGGLTGRDRFERSRFYQDFIRRFGDDTGHCAGALLRRPDGGFLTYGTHRAWRDEAFAPDDVRRLNLLNPHLIRAAAVDEALSLGRTRANHMQALIDHVERAVITIGPDYKVILVNPAAESIVDRQDGLLLSGKRLSAVAPSSRDALARAVGEALHHAGGRGGDLHVERAAGRPAYRLTISPLVTNGLTHALVLIDDPDQILPNTADRLRALYGFTPAEADVAILVAEGRSAEEVAAHRQVGLATVKTLLQRCYRKSGTKRASQLGRAVTSLPR